MGTNVNKSIKFLLQIDLNASFTVKFRINEQLMLTNLIIATTSERKRHNAERNGQS